MVLRPTNLAGKATGRSSSWVKGTRACRFDAAIPLFGSITRLADQKGLDIQLGALEEMLSSPLQFALLGSGSLNYEKAYRELAKRHPTKVAVRIGLPDQALSHRIEAGSDFYLMPSPLRAVRPWNQMRTVCATARSPLSASPADWMTP